MAATNNDAILRRVNNIMVALTGGEEPSPRVVAFGSVCTDTFWYFDKLGLHTEGKDQFFQLQIGAKIPCPLIEDSTGGSAANVASGLVKLGVPSTLLAAIGDDSVGASGVKELNRRGVDTSAMTKDPSSRSDMSTILRMRGVNDRTILTYKGAILTPATVKTETIKGASLFMWTSVAQKDAVQAIKKCIKACRKYGVKVAAAPSQAMITTHPADMLDLLSHTNVLSLNDDEIKLLTKTKTVPSAIAALLRRNPQMEVLQVTRGKDPSILVYQYPGGRVRVVKTVPPKVKILDKTGAGDSACAGLLYAYIKHTTPEMAAKYSAATSTSKITAKGAANGLLSAPELAKKLTEYDFRQTSFDSTLDALDGMEDI